MRRIEYELTEPAEHLALDEAILLEAENLYQAGSTTGEAIRVWEFGGPVVIAGRSTRVDFEINRAACLSHSIPIMRRCTGGASVVGGPGCLMYSVVLSFENQPALKRIDVAHQHVMGRVLKAIRNQVPDVQFQGTCDLTWQNKKCSGNSLRIARRHLLYHGTILYDFDLSLIAQCLAEAPRQPEYRQGRDHQSFVTNVPIDPATFTADLFAVFEASESAGPQSLGSLESRIQQLRKDRYDAVAWHDRH